MEYKADFSDFIEGLFTFIFVIIVLLWGLRLLLPFILKYVAKKMQKRFMNEFEKFQQQNASFSQSANFEQTTKEERPREKKIVGEYIDFEEIERK